jgi:transcriptional antiterminator NusG
VPLTENEIRSMGVVSRTQVEVDLEVGDTIKVISGAWEGTIGEIKSISMPKQSVTIDVDIFGRATSVEIGFLEVQKLS